MAPNRKLIIKIVSLGLISLIAVAGWIVGNGIVHRPMNHSRVVSLNLYGAPFSADPLEYDAFIHHIAIRPVFASLVTQYKAGSIQGVIADSWSSTPDLTTWRFFVRPSMMFSNGDPITPNSVVRSLTRMAWIQHSRASQSGLIEDLVGVEQLKSPSAAFPGITADANTVVLTFKKPQPKLLETISFGLYGIVHQSDFDQQTGAWMDSRHIISSGAYRLNEWTDDHLTLQLRDDFPKDLRHENAATKIKILWEKDPAARYDLATGETLATEGHEDELFIGSGTVTINPYYLYVWPWNLKSSPLHDKNVRISLRTAFYKRMEQSGFRVTRSFLPLIIPGINEFSDPNISSPEPKLTSTIKINSPRVQGKIYDKMVHALADAVRDLGGTSQVQPGAPAKEAVLMLDPNLPAYSVDITQRFTGILIEGALEDVRFMIQSKEGIRLPDPTGELAKEAAKPDTNLARINQILWEDAIAWPVTPFSMGLWARKDMFDFSQLNLSLPATDLSWIGLKE